jgi:hypothetical protein
MENTISQKNNGPGESDNILQSNEDEHNILRLT